MWKPVLVISIGGALGSLLRWWVSMALNSFFPTIPPGTLAVNLIAGYVIGAGITFFGGFSTLPPEWRLFLITGFCGGLSTFSTFSAELYSLVQQGRPLWALGEVAIHVIGSLAMTFLGAGTVVWLRGNG